MDFLQSWQAQGKIRDNIDEDLLPGFPDSLDYIDTHKDEVGIQYFPQSIQYLVEFIMQGLTNHPK